MKAKNITPIVLLISLLLNGAMAGFLMHRPVERSVEVVSVRDTVTQWIPIDVQAPAPEPRLIHTRQRDSIYIVDTLEVPLEDVPRRRSYADSIKVNEAWLHYRHSVTGFLNESTYAIEFPEVTIIEDVERTITERYDPRIQLSISAGYVWPTPTTQASIEFGLQGNYKDLGFYYRYDPLNDIHSTGALYRFIMMY